MMSPDETQQAWEQGEAAVMNIAKLIGSYYKQLRREGFTSREAMVLVVEYQRIMIGGAKT